MANPEHMEILKQGVEAWNKWRKENKGINPDLSWIELTDQNLESVNFRRVNLEHAKFLHTHLSFANLRWVNLNNAFIWESYFRGVNLRGATVKKAVMTLTSLLEAECVKTSFEMTDLSGVNFDEAILQGANLERTDIRAANSSQTMMRDANLSHAKTGLTYFSNVDISEVIGLDSIEHIFPSSIGIDTIYRSKGKIPESFLRGCGVPEDFIKLIPSLTSQPFEFYSCFISYSSQNDDFARRLHADLQGNKVRVWFAPEDLKIGDRIRDLIDDSILVHDKLLLILTEQSIQSDWVEKEVETAFEKERKNPGKTVLFPIRLDDAVMDTDKAWTADIRRTRHIGDFRDWKNHDSYKNAFNRLLRDLKASEK